MSENDEWVTLGSRLREVREYLNFSQQYVSAAIGMQRSAISDVERGQRKVDSLELRKLARLYGYPVSHFLAEDDLEAVEPPGAALARAMVDLTEDDQDEVLKFVQFLKFNAASKRPGER
ncbi:helix-turn-helix domain protein [Rhodococcus sp. MTM3W5.2]|uniref:helix-turn-helix domain-containing protein n=1 Tax=Rhodococcus sp. MTM3W5.2 TaxID=1805827 RepID=UPI0009792FBE|nr:helix-turn-helix transcriptional regulator [Rhodococcus sp. MTM3W5.2]AQA22424.1 helix-turn-helix domain protein [Rhodococcus sp. MTM3W5.2]